jgi:hypothetical protein
MRSRLFREGAFLFLLIHCLSANADCKGDDILGLSRYDGTVGRFRVRMTLALDGGAVTGIYFYASQLKDINVRGTIIAGSKLVLDEVDSADKVVARFDGTFPTSDPEHHFAGPLQCEVITGMWHKTDSNEELPFYLTLTDAIAGDLHHQYASAGVENDDVVNRGAWRFWDAVKRGDRKTAASVIDYPITVGRGTQCKITIHNSGELLKNYDRVLSPLRDAIAGDLPRAMFVHDELMALAGGHVWFGADGKVAALNISCP